MYFAQGGVAGLYDVRGTNVHGDSCRRRADTVLPERRQGILSHHHFQSIVSDV